MTKQLIAQGAEAKIFLINKNSEPNRKKLINNSSEGGRVGIEDKKILPTSKDFILKSRIPKGYRIKELDEKIRKLRTRSESKILEKASKIANVPKVIKGVKKNSKEKFDLELEYLDGDKLSDNLNSYSEKKQIQVMNLLGKQVEKLHDNSIIHGDLTTSNVILTKEEKRKNEENENPKQNRQQLINLSGSRQATTNKNEVQNLDRAEGEGEYKVFIIDFGLSFISPRLEDKAVDLHLIKQALEAKHYQNWENLYKAFLHGYNPKDKEQILEQLKKVELRGRNKH